MIKLIYPKFWSKKGCVSPLLTPFSYIYRTLGFLRKCFVKPVRLDCTVVCVGNVSVGGTGKTQLVLWLAQQLTAQKVKFLIVTKGYGSNLQGAKLVEKHDLASEVGDESILLSAYAPVLAAKTIKDALPIINKEKPDLVIFDDGLQNPGFVKDFSILVVDATRKIGNGQIFPAGPLREPVELALSRSDIVVVVGNDDIQNTILNDKLIASNKAIFKAQIKLIQTIDVHKKYYAFTAIGNPDRFYNLLQAQGLTLEGVKSFPDHHNYSQAEIDDLEHCAKEGAYTLITTRKDYVKIPAHNQIICANVALKFTDEKQLFNLIYEKIRPKN